MIIHAIYYQFFFLTNFTVFPSSHLPLFYSPLGIVNTPSPFNFPSFHSPTNFLPSSQANSPNPDFFPFSKFPRKFLPLANFKFPLPWIRF